MGLMESYLEGLVATAVVVIEDKMMFQDKGGETVRMLKLSGHGFTKSMVAENASQFSDWPEKGERLRLTCAMNAGKDSRFALGSPTFRPLTPAK